MKKIIIVAVFVLFSSSAFAQKPYDKSIGLRLGSSLGVTYKQFISGTNAFEIIGDAYVAGKSNNALSITGLYLWQWSIVDHLDWFVGPGASLGVVTGDGGGANLAIDGMIGLEYKFKIPLALGIDLNPRWYLLDEYGLGWSGALSIRYTF